jgi:hypothetical protein
MTSFQTNLRTSKMNKNNRNKLIILINLINVTNSIKNHKKMIFSQNIMIDHHTEDKL